MGAYSRLYRLYANEGKPSLMHSNDWLVSWEALNQVLREPVQAIRSSYGGGVGTLLVRVGVLGNEAPENRNGEHMTAAKQTYEEMVERYRRL